MEQIIHATGPKFEALQNAIKEINRLIASANHAESFRVESDKLARSLSVGFDQYGNRQVAEALLPTARDINARIAAEVTIEFEARRDRQIAAVAAAINNLRGALPDLAAKACVELGAVARDMKAGAA